ncbi:hypothetical protein HPB47_001447 [Ixodes persulcatus]|uniref:Uncharacterized protein n=1 Tax=Ixodes persulcatus TaxID=34615 RepID=A0AC60PP37_IXOPE|nr:hypothetical protein HPB47_001447 [Ixodes persulcatus]
MIQGCSTLKPGHINVHLLSHSHNDAGWISSLEDTYTESVQSIYDTTTRSLLANPQRRYVSAENVFFSRWWKAQSTAGRGQVSRLVREAGLTSGVFAGRLAALPNRPHTGAPPPNSPPLTLPLSYCRENFRFLSQRRKKKRRKYFPQVGQNSEVRAREKEAKIVLLETPGRGGCQFVGGGWTQNDEAVTHYTAIVDQMTLGLRFLNDTFGECGRPSSAWQADPFGHTRSQAALFAQASTG